MNINIIKSKLLVKYPFFGNIVANCSFIEQDTLKTAATDGENIYYNPNFVESITDEQKTFVFAHEICHIAFNHIFRSENKDKHLWNIATDSVINAFLKQDGLQMVEGGVDIPEAINYDAEEMYKKLLEEKNKSDDEQNQNSEEHQNNQGGSGSLENQSDENKQSDNYDVGHDTHTMWDDAILKKNQEEKFDEKKENKDNHNNELQKKMEQIGEKEIFKQNKIERKKQLDELRKSLASQSHGHGHDINGERRTISDIGISKALIDWRRILKETVNYDVDWSYQNAEIEDGVLTAKLEEIPKPETEIVLDTSGSIDENLLRNFLRECKNILKNSKVKVGCFDTRFYGFSEIKNESDIDNLTFYGGGGTDFNVAVGAFSKRVENKIIFTDGEAYMPDMPLDAIWIVFGGRKINPKGGKVIQIDDEQLKKLYFSQPEISYKGKSR